MGYDLEKVNAVKQTAAFKYSSVQKYLNRQWLGCMKRWVKALRDKRFEIGMVFYLLYFEVRTVFHAG